LVNGTAARYDRLIENPVEDEPMRLVISLFALVTIGAARVGADDAADLLDRAIAAHGGAEKLGRLKRYQEQTRGKLFAGDRPAEFVMTTVCQLPAQMRATIKADTGNRKIEVIQVLNEDKAWICDNGKTMEAPAQSLADLQELAHVQHVSSLLPLRNGKVYTLKSLGESKANDKPVLGIEVNAKGRRAVRLFFDKDTSLLVKREFKSRDTGKESLREEFLSEYKEIDGLKRAHTFLIHQDGKKYAEATLAEFKPLKEIDPDEFKKP
jgi:hypothetical protein